LRNELTAFRENIRFGYRNYIRQHRYLRELVAVVLFNIFFYGLLYGDKAEDAAWAVLIVFAVLLNLITAPSIFFWDRGNTLYFLLSQPQGRKRLFFSKICLIILIDLFWMGLFAALYGLRFLSWHYFLWLPLRLSVVALILALCTALISFSFSYRPFWSWIILALIIFGFILNKQALFPIDLPNEIYKLFALLLPPLLELTRFCTTLQNNLWLAGFLVLALLQSFILLRISYRRVERKDFV